MQGALAVVAAFELAKQAAAVGMQLGLEGKPGEVEHGWEKIHADHRFVRNATGEGDARGADQCGFANTAFVKPAFAGAEREIAAGADPAKSAEASIVTEENHNRVFVE